MSYFFSAMSLKLQKVRMIFNLLRLNQTLSSLNLMETGQTYGSLYET